MEAVLFENKGKVSIADVPEPAIREDEVLIRIQYCGICATDIALYHGDMPYIMTGGQTYPFIPGHEWAGKVVDFGPEVTSVKKGDPVTGDVSLGCGKCKECREGKYNLCGQKTGVGCYRNRQGALAEYIAIPERHVYKFSSKMDIMAAAIAEPLATALHGLARNKKSFDDVILVTGAGFIGILAAQAAQLNKNAHVILTGRSKQKLQLAMACGVEHVISESELDAFLMTAGLAQRIDFCIECSGNIAALQQCLKHTKFGGQISIIGFYEDATHALNLDTITTKNLDIHGILGSPNFFLPALSLLEKRLIHYEPLITKIFNLDEIEEALDFMRNKKNNVLKVMMRIGKDNA
jgi:2-desacetyl-2-hydroxyethyl bacteriochlorophyllide A dehydrogenase